MPSSLVSWASVRLLQYFGVDRSFPNLLHSGDVRGRREAPDSTHINPPTLHQLSASSVRPIPAGWTTPCGMGRFFCSVRLPHRGVANRHAGCLEGYRPRTNPRVSPASQVMERVRQTREVFDAGFERSDSGRNNIVPGRPLVELPRAGTKGARGRDLTAKGLLMRSQLTEKQQRLYSLFKIAIGEEQKAQKLYQEALQCADDPKMRSIIESFIREEKTHEETLLRLYSEFRKTGEFEDEG